MFVNVFLTQFERKRKKWDTLVWYQTGEERNINPYNMGNVLETDDIYLAWWKWKMKGDILSYFLKLLILH